MKTEYDVFVASLVEKYPELYENVYCGIAVGEGWYPIVDKLSSLIYNRYKWKTKRGDATEFPKVAQIKEKFGGLRFYIDGADEYVHGAIHMAEFWASTTCEQCGDCGTLREGGWLRTLCDKHEAERQERMNARDS